MAVPRRQPIAADADLPLFTFRNGFLGLVEQTTSTPGIPAERNHGFVTLRGTVHGNRVSADGPTGLGLGNIGSRWRSPPRIESATF